MSRIDEINRINAAIAAAKGTTAEVIADESRVIDTAEIAAAIQFKLKYVVQDTKASSKDWNERRRLALAKLEAKRAGVAI